MSSKEKLANLMITDDVLSVEELEKKYPIRQLEPSALITRFAPSPTGFLHTGSLFTAMISHKLASQSNGVFYVRLEDTDTKREIKGAGIQLIEQLNQFNVGPNEGYLGINELGVYGPYKQSERADIYKSVIKEMILQGKAYPCFCTSEELSAIRQEQEASKVVPGYYGAYAKCRHFTDEECIKLIEEGSPFVIRFKSSGNHLNKITVKDMIRGEITIAQNDLDVVILKSDGLPTYHFAHVVDDHFMKTTIVARGEEWISSLPIHIEMFESLSWNAPNYAHLPLINKLDNGNKRKLSKRKDPEASVEYFISEGYPVEGVLLYLMSIANSNFEEWVIENKTFDIDKFNFSLSKMSLDGALFDINKLNYFSKEFLASLNKDEITQRILVWAKDYCIELYELINNDVEYFKEIINIEREKENPRKDYFKYSNILENVKFFYSKYYNLLNVEEFPFNQSVSKEVIKNVLREYLLTNDYTFTNQEWFANIKVIAEKNNFAINNKEYKLNPESFNGNVASVAEIIRIMAVGSKFAPDLYSLLQVLGKEEVERRINKIIK